MLGPSSLGAVRGGQRVALPRIARVTPALLDDLVRAAASEVLAARGLDLTALPADPAVGRTRHPAQGEYATSVALRTGPRVGVAPRELADWLADALARRPEVADARGAGAGFVTLRMSAAGRAAVVADALAAELPDAAALAAAVRVPAELVAAVGPDVARYAVLRSPTGAVGDLALLRRAVPENPAFLVRYAHARAVALARNAADLGVAVVPGPLTEPAEVELVACLAAFPAAVRGGEPHRLAAQLEALARAVLDLQPAVLPRGDEGVTDLHRARLAAVVAAGRLLATGLGLLGVTAPDRI